MVKPALGGFGPFGAVPAEVGRLSALRELWLHDNQLMSVPAEIGQLAIAEGWALVAEGQSADERAGGDRALSSLEVLGPATIS